MKNGRNNTLDELLEAQSSFMTALGIDPKSGTLAQQGAVSKSELGAAVGIVLEAAEVLAPLEKANRKWKPNGNTASEVKEELIDVVFFILELAVLLGLTGDDLVDLYRNKLRKNVRRLYGAVIRGDAEMTEQLHILLLAYYSKDEMAEMVNELYQEDMKEKR